MLKEKVISLRKYAIFLALLMFVLYPLTAEAVTHTYISSYDMTGGVFSKSYYQPSSFIETTVIPEKGTDDCNMGIIWAKKYAYGWDGDIKYVSSTRGGTATFYTSDKRKIWLRDFAGTRWTGTVVLKWD
ncbi:MAG TPA: hypothetical protein DCW90_11445 [Lachnospiraceae bacterium]|nr:hypothetical protein [uncultured Lachnoclostridium sp.]HAU86077.1 hypothetical protein [Lachnospiraceae bacterium]